MILLGNVLYTVLSENTIKYSEIPLYENPKKYNEKLIENYFIIGIHSLNKLIYM